MYCEDVDLSMRLRLLGGRLAGCPETPCVSHDYAFDKGHLKWRLLERNRWATLVRTPAATPAGRNDARSACDGGGRVGSRNSRRLVEDEAARHA